jgi:hypothetical protein
MTSAQPPEPRKRRAPNRRADYPESEFEVPRRRWADMTAWQRALRSAQTFMPLLVLVQIGYMALGFQTVKPNDRLVSIEAQLHDLRLGRDSDRAQTLILLNRTNALARYRCLSLDAETAYQLGLDCAVLLPGYQFNPKTRGVPVDPEDGAPKKPARDTTPNPVPFLHAAVVRAPHLIRRVVK